MKYPFPYQEEYPHLADVFEQFQQRHQRFLNNSIVRGFLKTEKHLNLLVQAVCFPSNYNRERLNNVFKVFYIEVRLVKYFSTLLHNNSVTYDKKIRKNKERYSLILDQQVTNGEDETTTLSDLIVSEKTDILYMLTEKSSLEEQITHPRLSEALKQMTTNQLRVLELSYIYGLKDTEIAKLFGVSQQVISKTHKKSLKRIRNYFKESDNK